jgi:hypothetical protein
VLVRALNSAVCIAGAASTPCQPHGQCCRGTAYAGMSRQNRYYSCKILQGIKVGGLTSILNVVPS